MLTIADISMIGDSPEGITEDFLAKYLPRESFLPWLTKTWPGGGLAMTTYPNGTWPCRPFKLNRLYWPTRATRWAYGHFLCDSDSVQQISDQAFNSDGSYNKVVLQMGNPEVSANASQTGANTLGVSPNDSPPGEILRAKMWVLPPTPLSGIRGLSGDVRSLYLITVVDQRYFWWQRNMGDLKIDKNTQWLDLYSNIKNTLNISFENDTIDPAYLQPSIQMFSLPYEPIPIIFDAVADNVGQRVVVNYDESVGAINYMRSRDIINNDMMQNPKRIIIAGGQRFSQPL